MAFIMEEEDSTHKNTNLRANMKMAIEKKAFLRLMTSFIKAHSIRIFMMDMEF